MAPGQHNAKIRYVTANNNNYFMQISRAGFISVFRWQS